MTKQHFAIDLDGTLLQYDGFKNLHDFGDPIPHALEWVTKKLAAGHKITVFTTRPNFAEVQKALLDRGFPKLEVTNVKSHHFSCFIDDRAMTFDGPDDWEFFTLDDFKPWWQRGQ